MGTRAHTTHHVVFGTGRLDEALQQVEEVRAMTRCRL